ncbi:MAG TPA: hypothetical protein VG474_05935, partial [Solirubrobacteraceae bacterium]|nr:hypothetical protein [Solirubrobacteraceae bacterium]
DLGRDGSATELGAQLERAALVRELICAGPLQGFSLFALERKGSEGFGERQRREDGDAGRVVGADHRDAEGDVRARQGVTHGGDEA